MNQELWEKFDKLRASPLSGHEGLADFFRKEEIRFAPKIFPLGESSSPVGSARSGGTIHVPEWLMEVFRLLAKDAAPRTICDPWAGAGFLLKAIREECSPERALAFTQFQSIYELGKVLVPRAEWKLGDPLAPARKAEQRVGCRRQHSANGCAVGEPAESCYDLR